MKKKIISLVGAMVVISTIVSVINVVNLKKERNILKDKVKHLEETYSSVYLEINSLTYNTFKNKVNNKEEFYVYFGRPNCSDCSEFDEDLIDILERYNAKDKLYYLNVREIRDNNVEWKNFKDNYDIKYTPSFAKFSNGKVENIIEWTKENGLSKESVISWVKENLS